MMIYNLSTTKEMKQQLEGDFKVLMTNIGTSQPDPAWFIDGEFCCHQVGPTRCPGQARKWWVRISAFGTFFWTWE